jgi:hypothetical protein
MMMSAKLSRVLSAAADLIEPKDCWVRDWTARKVNEKDPSLTDACLATDPRAIKWGGLGAIYKVGREMGLSNDDCWAAQDVAARTVGVKRFTDWAWAPGRSQVEVVDALREAAGAALTAEAA